jgi:L-fuconate dehydratase
LAATLRFNPQQLLNTLDLSYLEEDLPAELVIRIMDDQLPGRPLREKILTQGYPGYDTSVGWFQYEDHQLREKAKRALGSGFRALKLKVGSQDSNRDVRRATLLRELAGDGCQLMLDANQQWTVPQAESVCNVMRDLRPHWIEEPTHPDDVAGHAKLAHHIAPMNVALGEHVPNRILFRNFMEQKGVHFVQVDCTRVAGVSEFITVSLLARKFGLPVVPHVGYMGQIHQHLVLFNHVAMGHAPLFLEYIPHLRPYFVHPARAEDGAYRAPQEAGLSCDLVGSTA